MNDELGVSLLRSESGNRRINGMVNRNGALRLKRSVTNHLKIIRTLKVTEVSPHGNHNALSHGLFAKHLSPETKDLIQELYTSNLVEVIWNNIMI